MPAQSTYTAIATTTLTSAGQIAFGSIPQTYTDLVLVFYSRNATSTGTGTGIRLNSNSSITAYWTWLTANGSSATSSRSTNSFGYANLIDGIPSNATANLFGSGVVHFPNYTNTAVLKTAIGRSANDQNGSGTTKVAVATYPTTAAIVTIDLGADGGTNFAIGTQATLYGIAAA